VIGKPGDGASPSCAIVDEYHEHDTSELVDTMETGMGAREQPLLLMITTAGFNIAGPCYDQEVEAKKVLEGTLDDPELFALIYTIDEGDDWTSPRCCARPIRTSAFRSTKTSCCRSSGRRRRARRSRRTLQDQAPEHLVLGEVGLAEHARVDEVRGSHFAPRAVQGRALLPDA
jgi:hypothetical protein